MNSLALGFLVIFSLPFTAFCQVSFTTVRVTINGCLPSGLPNGGNGGNGGLPLCQHKHLSSCLTSEQENRKFTKYLARPHVKQRIYDKKYGVYCFVGFFPPTISVLSKHNRAVSPGPLFAGYSTRSSAMTPEYCLDNVCQAPANYFGIAEGQHPSLSNSTSEE